MTQEQAEIEALKEKLKTWKEATVEQMKEDSEFFNSRDRQQQAEIEALKEQIKEKDICLRILLNQIEDLLK